MIFNQSYRHTPPDTLGLLQHTYCWEIWNATGNSSTDSLSEHNNFSDLWINIHKIAEFKPTIDTHLSQMKLTTFSWRCPQLAYWNSHCKRHPQHQNMDKPTYCHTDITAQHPGTHCVNLEYYKVCHTGNRHSINTVMDTV